MSEGSQNAAHDVAATAVHADVSHGAEAAAHGAEGASSGFPPFDPSLFQHQLFWFAIAFGGLYLLLAFVIIPKISATLGARRGQIERDLKEAADETQKAELAKANAEKAQADARANARGKLEAMRKKVDDENAVAQAKAISEAEELIKASEAKINEEKSNALSNISDEVLDIASTIFEQIIGKKPSAASLKAANKGAN